MDNNKLLTRDDFLSDVHLKRELVPVPELGGSIYLRELSTPQLLEFREIVEGYTKQGMSETSPAVSIHLMSLLVSFSACDEKGELIFSKEDADELGRNRLLMLERLSKKAMELSGMNVPIDEATEALKKVKIASSSSSFAKSSPRRKRK